MDKEDRNCIPRHLVTLVEDFDAWNDYPWGEYMWAKFYERTVNIVYEHRQHHLDEKKKNPNYNATYNLYGFAWAFKIWILESYPNSKQWWSKKDNVIPRCLAWTNITKFDKSHYNRLFGPDCIPIVNLDPTPAEKIQAWFESSIPFFNGIVDDDWKGCGDDSVLVSKDNSVDEDCNVCEDASAGLSKDEILNDKLVDQECNVLLEDGDGLFDSEAGCRDSEEDNENQPANVSIRDLYSMIKVHEQIIANLDRILKEKNPNDDAAENTKPNMIPNHSHDIPSCSVLDLNSNQTGVDQELGGAANDPMVWQLTSQNQMNDYNCSQPIHASVDAPIQACAYASDHPELDVLQHEAHVDRSGPKINEHLMAEPLTADEFRDDYMSVLNDEEIIPNVSLDDMKFQHEEENLPVKDTPLEHQPVDELIDAQKDSTNLLPENVKDEINKSKYVNVVKADYKPPLETVFAANIRSKKKKCGLQKKCVLRSVQERKKKLAMALGSPYGQLGTTTLAPPKTRSMTSIGDTIVALEFEVEISGQPKIMSLNELPDGCKKDKVTIPDKISEFLKMQDPPKYRFPWGSWDLTVDRIFWLQLACLDLAKKGWLGDSHLDLWVDLLWSFREPDADWAMVSPYFLPCILGGSMHDYFSNGVRYPVAWRNVEKVYIPVNEPQRHWCLAELQISTGVVTFYDTLGWVKGNRRPWWRNMKRNLPQQLTSYLNEHGVLASKGISVERYEIKYAFPNVVRQADESGDCGVWLKSFLCYMRSLIIIDVAHLKGTYQGTNLVAVGMDGNNQIIPIATGVSQGETGESWTWFLRKLKDCIGEVPNLAIISDRHYAIILACKTVFPNSFHGFCCRYLMMNCGMQNERYKVLYWSTCKAYTEQEFDKLMSDIQVVRPDAHYKLVEAGIEKWSRAKCPANRYNYMTSNSAESVNALTKEDEELTPWASAKIRYRMLKSSNWIVNGVVRYNIYEVRDNKMIHMVYLEKGECTCRRWQLSGLPCGHVCAIARVEALTNVNNLAKPWFLNSTIKATYEGIVYPVKDIPTWQTPNDLQVVLPLVMGNKLPGRQKTKIESDHKGWGRYLLGVEGVVPWVTTERLVMFRYLVFKCGTVMMDREALGINDIVRRLMEVATELQASLNTRQEIINEAAISKNTKMKKSVAFFREQQDQDLKFMRDILSKISETQLRTFEKTEFVDYIKKI
ncbi:phospholipase-like protein [Tanacetum coccineum]